MRSVSFEPDCLGSLRVFSHGKVRMQFYKASNLSAALKASDVSDFAKECEELVLKGIHADPKNLPPSTKCLVDASAGPVALVVPPGMLVVQEALDQQPCAGVRRSFTPFASYEDFSLACSDKFAAKASILAALCK